MIEKRGLPVLPKSEADTVSASDSLFVSLKQRNENLINVSDKILAQTELLKENLFLILGMDKAGEYRRIEASRESMFVPASVSKPLDVIENASKDFLKFALLAIGILNDKIRKMAADFLGGFLRKLGVPEIVIEGLKWAVNNLDKVLLIWFGIKMLRRIGELFGSIIRLSQATKALFLMQSFEDKGGVGLPDLENKNKKLARQLARSRELNKKLRKQHLERVERIRAKYRRSIIDLREGCKKRTARLRERIKGQKTLSIKKTSIIEKLKNTYVSTTSLLKETVTKLKNNVKIVGESLKKYKTSVVNIKSFFSFLRKGTRLFRLGIMGPAIAAAIPSLGISILVAYGVGTLVDSLIGSVVDYAFDTEKRPDQSIFNRISEIFVKNIISSATFGIVDKIPDWVKKMLGFDVKKASLGTSNKPEGGVSKAETPAMASSSTQEPNSASAPASVQAERASPSTQEPNSASAPASVQAERASTAIMESNKSVTNSRSTNITDNNNEITNLSIGEYNQNNSKNSIVSKSIAEIASSGSIIDQNNSKNSIVSKSIAEIASSGSIIDSNNNASTSAEISSLQKTINNTTYILSTQFTTNTMIESATNEQTESIKNKQAQEVQKLSESKIMEAKSGLKSTVQQIIMYNNINNVSVNESQQSNPPASLVYSTSVGM
jgi:hypothetical protein